MYKTTKKKIALLGSAPSSIRLAPYSDPEWFIIGCSPGCYGVAPRSDAWFENHRWEPQVPGKPGTGKSWFSPEYVEFMTRHKGDVWMTGPVPHEIPNAREIPYDYLINKYGPFFFSSSLSWMWALALETPGVEEIGMWGVDMSASEEYGYQRQGCQHFIQIALDRGIKITVPPESDILQPAYFYGLTETAPMMVKLTERRRELQERHARAEQTLQGARDEMFFLKGALDDIDYMIKTWVTFQSYVEPKFGKTGNEVRASIAADMKKESEDESRSSMEAKYKNGPLDIDAEVKDFLERPKRKYVKRS